MPRIGRLHIAGGCYHVMGRSRNKWQDIDTVLEQFSKHRNVAREAYRQFIEDGKASKYPIDLSGGGLVRSYGGWDRLKRLRQDHLQRIGDERILGDSDFVERVLWEDNLSLDKQALREHQGLDMPRLIERVCSHCAVNPDRLVCKGRANQLALAKSLICYWATSELGMVNREVAERLQISQPVVSMLVKKGQLYCQEQGLELDTIL